MDQTKFIALDVGMFGSPLTQLLISLGEEEPDITEYLEYLVDEIAVQIIDSSRVRSFYYNLDLNNVSPVLEYGIIKCLQELDGYRINRVPLVNLLMYIVEEIFSYVRTQLQLTTPVLNIIFKRTKHNNYYLGVLVHETNRDDRYLSQ